MENVCDRMLELDNGRCFMHDFGGPGSYEQWKEVGRAEGAAAWGLGFAALQRVVLGTQAGIGVG